MIRKTFILTSSALFISSAIFSQKLFTKLLPKETGINFKNEIAETEELNVISYEYFYNGGGVAVGDINNDGLEDLYFTANMKPDKLYLNLGGLKFKDITREAKITNKPGWKTGVTMADVNADGLLDIYVCYSGSGDSRSRENQLYINNGNLTFTERSKAFGLNSSAYSTQAAFFDYDRDGDLDMYLLNLNIKDFKDIELAEMKTIYDSLAGDKLYKNENGVFKDVSSAARISGNPISYGLGLSIADINNDGWLDIYVSNDFRENDYLYINNKDGTFSEKSKECLRHMSEFSMGNDIADFNNDGWLDIITLDMLPEDNRRQKLLLGPENYDWYKALVANGFQHQLMRNMLQLNNQDGTFSEIGQLAGVSNTDWSWSPLFADFDNDGYKDLFISNGFLRDYTNRDFLKFWANYTVAKAANMEKSLLMDLVTQMPSTLTQNYLFKNGGNLTFSNKTDDWGMSELMLTHGAVYADLDNDGDLDLVINNVNEAAYIYKNQTSETVKPNYLKVKLESKGKNPFAFGARVQVFSKGQTQTLELNPTHGFQSCSSKILHFGLGNIPKIDSLVIRWPRGSKQVIQVEKINQQINVREPEANQVSKLVKTKPAPLFENADYFGLNFLHREYDFNDFRRQPLIPFMLSHCSPALAKADVNGDHLEDVFVGSSRNQASKLFIQQLNGSFKEKDIKAFEDSKLFTASDATFLDIDNDGDVDLYVASGGYHDFEEGSPMLADRLFLNDGQGNFSKSTTLELFTSKSCVEPADFNNDGTMDIFLGGRVVPGRYPEAPPSYLLQNNGHGVFSDVTEKVIPEIRKAGMITDAVWRDLNNDGKKDLLVVGEWMTPMVFINDGSVFHNRTSEYFDKTYFGLWNTLVADDLDGDGDIDLKAGNLGLNTQLKASTTQPAELWYSDFDGNGSVDPFLCYYIQGKNYPYVSRDELMDQMYVMRKKFTDYKSYADATLSDILDATQLSQSQKLSSTTFETTLFENVNGKFVSKTLPIQTQYSPVYSILVKDINKDGKKDILLLGNNNHARLKIGRIDANYGIALIQKGIMQFEYIPQTESGLSVQGDVKDSMIIDTSTDQLLVIGINGGSLITYKLRK